MKLHDSRRLTGPNLFGVGPGAVIEVSLDDAEVEGVIAAWRSCLRRMVEALGWERERTAWRADRGGLCLAFSAPIDMLFVATEVNEWAWSAAWAALTDTAEPSFDDAREELMTSAIDASRPAMIEVAKSARARGLSVICDDLQVSVGTGAGSRTWSLDEVPAPEAVPWSELYDVPIALVAGTNGKTTTVRMLESILVAAGHSPGSATSDGIIVGGEIIEVGDHSGSGGATPLLRDRRVDAVVLELSRGGLLRRGLTVDRADVAVVTNIAGEDSDEMDERSIDRLADVQLLVSQVARHLVLNAAAAAIVGRSSTYVARDVRWFRMDDSDGAAAAPGCSLEDEHLVVHRGGPSQVLMPVGDVVSALGGAARHNVANALAAATAAVALDIPDAAIRSGLAGFDVSSGAHPGRLNTFELGGVRAIVDGAHNAHGLSALMDMASRLERTRLLVVLGQAGDRDDASIRELARVVWAGRPDRVLVKEMRGFLRGRRVGEVPGLLHDELRAVGAVDDIVGHADTELDAVRQALEWSRPGDVLLLLCHAECRAVLALLERLHADRWIPGTGVLQT